VLTVISGLPGAGKTAVAGGLAVRTNAVHLSIDPVEDALLASGATPGWTTGVGAYEATRAMAEQNLALGQTVIVDAVNDSEAARDTWRQASAATASKLLFIVLNPPSPDEHKRRLAGRTRSLVHVAEPTWEMVVTRAAEYAP